MGSSFEAIGRAVGGPVGAELLVYAADALTSKEGEDGQDTADALIDAALALDAGSRLAIDRTLRSAWHRQQWPRLATSLAKAEAIVPAEARGPLLAQRAEILGDRLGRVQEAVELYREAATASKALMGIALAAADELLLRHKNAPDWRDSTFTWPSVVPGRPAFDPFMVAGLVDEPESFAIAEFRTRLADGFDREAFASALDVGIEQGVLHVARWVAPGMSSVRRLAEIDMMIAAADSADDTAAARRLRAASFAERPMSAVCFEAARQTFQPDDPSVHLRLIALRWRATDEVADRSALLKLMIPLAQSAQMFEVAAEAHLALLAVGDGEVAARLTALKALQEQVEAPLLMARGLCAASVRQDIGASTRRSLWAELARMLEALDDVPGATSLRAELAVLSASKSLSDYAPSQDDRQDETEMSDARLSTAQAVTAFDVRSTIHTGELEAAAGQLKAGRWPPSVAHALWKELAELAESLGDHRLAAKAYAVAHDCAASSPAQHAARRGQARVAAKLGAHREAAAALAGVSSGRVAGRAYLAARDLVSAREAFGRALDQDLFDVEAAAELARLHAEDGNRSTIERLADAMNSQPLADDRRAVWLDAHGRALHRLGEYTAARQHFVKAMRLDVANIDAASGLVALGVDVHEPEWVDEGLVGLRARSAAQGDWSRAFVAAAVLVGRGRATTADRLTYERLRPRLHLQPQTSLPEGWLGRWLGLIHDLPDPGPLSLTSDRYGGLRSETQPWRPGPRSLEVIRAVQRLFGAPSIEWRADEGSQIWRAPDAVVVGRGVPRWRRRWRFEVGRALAAVVEPRLAAGLDATNGTPDIAHLVVDRAGLIAAGDPAVALQAVGPHSPRGRRLVPFAVSDTLRALWRSVGLGLVDEPSRSDELRRGLGPPFGSWSDRQHVVTGSAVTRGDDRSHSAEAGRH